MVLYATQGLPSDGTGANGIKAERKLDHFCTCSGRCRPIPGVALDAAGQVNMGMWAQHLPGSPHLDSATKRRAFQQLETKAVLVLVCAAFCLFVRDSTFRRTFSLDVQGGGDVVQSQLGCGKFGRGSRISIEPTTINADLGPFLWRPIRPCSKAPPPPPG